MFLFYIFVSYFVYSVFLYCFMYSISFCIYSCLFPIFVHVYRPLPPGGISTAVNKYHNLPVAVMPLPLSIYCRFITSFIATFCVKMLHHFYLKYFSFILPPHPRILYTAVVHEDGQVGRNTLQNTIISEKIHIFVETEGTVLYT